jgi:hypothetical protein
MSIEKIDRRATALQWTGTVFGEKFTTPCLGTIHHKSPGECVDQPHKHMLSTYGTTVQYTKDADASSKLDQTDKLFIQQVVGKLLHYVYTVHSWCNNVSSIEWNYLRISEPNGRKQQ